MSQTTNKMSQFLQWIDLAAILTLRETKRRYKQKYLRFAWAFISPLFSLVVFTLVFSRVTKLPSEGVPYPVFSFVALVPWYFFAACLTTATISLVTNAHLITRVKFPRIILPISSICSNLPDFAVSLLMMVLLFVFYGVDLADKHLIYLIPIFLIQLLLTVGIAFLLSIGNVYIRDINNALGIVLQAWLLFSPVAYSLSMVKHNRFLYLLNPMAGLLDGYRKVLIHHSAPNFVYLAISFLVSILIFALGCWTFRKWQRNLADAL